MCTALLGVEKRLEQLISAQDRLEQTFGTAPALGTGSVVQGRGSNASQNVVQQQQLQKQVRCVQTCQLAAYDKLGAETGAGVFHKS